MGQIVESPCPKIDVKFLSLNSTTLSPILTYHGFANSVERVTGG